jgi:hypothetical protein
MRPSKLDGSRTSVSPRRPSVPPAKPAKYIVAELQAAGMTSLNGIATALNDRHLHASRVRSLVFDTGFAAIEAVGGVPAPKPRGGGAR